MATIIDGKAVAEKVRAEVAEGVAQFVTAFGRAPGLDVVLVGDDPASKVYVGSKERVASKVGFISRVHRLPASTTQEELESLVGQLNEDPAVDGILVQLPLPPGLAEEPILELVRADKDVDGFHALNVGALWSKTPTLVPCTPKGCLRLLDEAGVELRGKRALVIGRSNLVGKPMAALLLGRDATVTMAHSKTLDLPARCREADVVIAAVGRAKLVKGDWVRPGAVVIDVGMNRTEAGALCGDVDFETVEPVASLITKVPGGVGPMTIAMLLANTLQAARARASR